MDNSRLQNASPPGTLTIDVEFTISDVLADSTQGWKIGTCAEESLLSGGEINFDNNIAYSLSNDGG